MKHFLYVDHVLHDFGLAKVSWNPIQDQGVDVRLELVRVHGRFDSLSPKQYCDIVRHQLPFAGVFEECFADLRARVDGPEHVATGTMIITRDRPEGFALCAFAAARRTEKDK